MEIIKESRQSLRELCLQEALKCLSRGEKDFSLRDIARKLNVSHGAPYRHFPTKEALLAALSEQSFLQLQESLQEAVQSAHSATEKLMRFGFAYQKFAEIFPQQYSLMFDETMKDDSQFEGLQKASMAPLELLQSIAEQLQIEGQLQSDTRAKDFAIFIWSFNHGLAQLLMEKRMKILGLAMALSEKRYRELASPLLNSLQF